MSRQKIAAILAFASFAVIASVAIFLANTRQPRVEKAVEGVPAPSADERQGAGPSRRSAGEPIPAGADSTVNVAPPEAGAAELEIHRKATKAFIAHTRENTQRLYGSFFQAKGLSPALQNEMTAILSQPMQALTDESIVAMRAGVRTTPPSPETLRVERTRQDQAVRDLLGDEGFAEFSSYRKTVPDRIIIQGMQRQGAELSDEQSLQMLQILTEERRRLNGVNGVARNPDSLPPGEVMSIIRQEQEQLRDAVSRRVETLLTPDQIAAMGDVFERLIRPRAPRQ